MPGSGSAEEACVKSREWVGGLFWLIVGLVLSIWSSHYRVGNIIKPGPGFFPLGLGLLLILFALILIVKQTRKTSAVPQTPSFVPGGWRRVAYVVSILLVSTFAFEHLGVLVTFFLLVIFTMRWAGSQTWRRSLLTGIFSVLGIYLVFVVVLKQQLPCGFLGM